MKLNTIKLYAIAALIALTAYNCNNDDDSNTEPIGPDFSGTYIQEDQMGRPAVNTVFVSSSSLHRYKNHRKAILTWFISSW